MPIAFELSRVRVWALVWLASVVAHAPALGAGFVWLDHAHIEDGGAFAKSVTEPFTQGFAGTGFYRPLVVLSLMLDQALGGSPFVFHLSTLLWHAAAAIATAAAAEALGLSLSAALIAGSLFAVHPLTSLVASAIAFRSEAMIAVALLGLVVAHVRSKPAWAAAALLFGGLCKETVIALGPLFIAALELGRVRAPAEPALRRRLLGSEAAALAGVLALRFAYAPAWRASFPDLSWSEALGTRLAAFVQSIAVMTTLAPFNRTICDAVSVTSTGAVRPLVGVLGFGTLCYLAWRRRGLFLLFALALLPSLQIVPIMRWWSPHYLYVALAFGALIVAQITANQGQRAWPWMAAFVLVLGTVSFFEAFRFASDAALWAPEVERNPGCREGQFYLAESERERRQWPEAERRYELAIRQSRGVLSYVDLKAAYTNLGAVELEQRRPAEAVTAFGAALALASDGQERRRLTHNLATASLFAGDATRAADLLEPEVARSDALPESILIRAKALSLLGREAEAKSLAERLRSISKK